MTDRGPSGPPPRALETRLSQADADRHITKLIDEYLLRDLARMSARDADGFRVGFPLVATAFAGIELLGRLARAEASCRQCKAGGKSCRHDFFRFWSEYLYPDSPSRADMAKPLYLLVRHGLAHTFMPKGRIFVTFEGEPAHLRPREDGFAVDALALRQALEIGYETRFRPVFDGKVQGRFSPESARRALESLLVAYDADAASELGKLVALSASSSHGHTIAVSAADSIAHVSYHLEFSPEEIQRGVLSDGTPLSSL